MASTKEIKRRITSIKNTKKITKAMELVSASKMKKAVAQTTQSRIYAGYSWEVLTSLSNYVRDNNHPFFEKKEGNKKLVVLITSNRGLCGGYNTQIIRKVLGMVREHANDEIHFVTVGKKGDGSVRRLGKEIVASFVDLPQSVRLSDTLPIAEFVSSLYEGGEYSEVFVAYTDYVSALTQKPTIRKLLPISKAEIQEGIKETLEDIGKQQAQAPADYIFEPGYEEVMKQLVVKIVRMQIYQMILESNASEQSARMIAMKNATDAAGEMIEDLTLMFNKARQAGITQEISEISAGMASVS